MYKLDIPLDEKEAAVINQRQRNEEDRKSRIFNARTRFDSLLVSWDCVGVA